tara:strand:- start:840 stop:1220 length:381 start_codon:yes stop_codon:yes gene_type:complete
MDLDFAHYIQFFFALAFVIGLIGLVTLVMRHYGLGGAIKFNARSRNGRRRIAVVDAIGVDARRRLILIRRDDLEHLVLLGAHDDLLIEGGIIPPETEENSEDTENSSQTDSSPFRAFVRSLRNARQ